MVEAWQEIESLVDDIASLSTAGVSTRDFYAGLLERAVNALAASGGAVWSRRSTGQLHLEYQVNFSKARLASREDQRRHAQLVADTILGDEPKLAAPHSGSPNNGHAGNPTDHLLVLCPFQIERESAGLIEVLQRAGTEPAAQRGYLRFVGALGELATEFHRNRQLRELQDRELLWGQFDQFSAKAHRQLEVRPTAYAIANEGRPLIDCDRLSVAVRRGSKYRLLAVSGLDTLDRRANTVRRLERLATAVAKTGEPLWYSGETATLSPQIEDLLQAYLDESHVRQLAVLPLSEPEPPDAKRRRAKPLGALIVERFDVGPSQVLLEQRANLVARHSMLALRNAQQYENLPLLPLSRLLNKIAWLGSARQLPKTVLVLAAVAAAVAALILVPADFNVKARGELQPQVRQDVFAPTDGVVSELHVQHASQVKKGDTLAVLRKPQLDLEFSRVVGELQTTRKRLSAVQAARLGGRLTGPDAKERLAQLTAEEEELKELLRSLEQQNEILRLQQTELLVKSPISGHVLTWNLKQLLDTRPVERGQTLMTVADLESLWVAEIHMPDDRVGYLLEAQRELQPDLKVSYILETDPDIAHVGKLEKIAMSTETDEATGPRVLVTVNIDRRKISGLRPGATVVARVHCGRKPVGYVWFHDLVEAVQTWLFF